MTDHQALGQYASHRDPAAFRILVEHYQQLVYAAARRRLARTHDVEDAVQTTFLKLARAAGTIRRDGSGLAAWLYTTTLNTANEMIRADASRRRRESLSAGHESLPENSAHTDHEESHRLTLLVDQALLDLPAEQQALIIEHYLRGRSQRDLAAELSVSQPTIMRRLDAAVAALRDRLAQHGYTAALLPAALQQLPQSPIPTALTGQLAKIGLAGATATKAAAIPLFAITFGTGVKIALAAATLALLIAAGIIISSPPKTTPPMAGQATAATVAAVTPEAATLPAPPADLAPTDLPFTRTTIHIDNLSGEMAALQFSQQAAFPVHLSSTFPATPEPPFSLHLQDVPFLDALLQFAGRTNGIIVPHASDSSSALIGTGTPVPAGMRAVSGPFAAYLGGSGVSLGGTLPRPQLNLQFFVEPQNTRFILFPDALIIESFVDELQQPIRFEPGRSVPGLTYSPDNRSLSCALLLPPNPGKRLALLKGTAPFRLVTRTQTITTAAPTDHLTEPFGDAAIEFSPPGTRLDGPFDMYRNFECKVIFHRNKMDLEAWHMFITHVSQARFTFTDSNGELIRAIPTAMNTPLDNQSVNITFVTSANERRTDPKSIRIEIPTESRRILFPFEFKDFPLPGAFPGTRGN